jgi:acetylornithine deacetylase/succinyl-diaminopimelate desuccinylase-like protein
MSRPFRCAAVLTALLLTLVVSLPAQESTSPVAPAKPSEASFARDLLRELVEIDTTPANGCTRAAQAMAARLRSAGFADSDVLLLGSRPDRQNVVVRLRGNGQAKPILLIAHLDVVDAPREGWSAGLDPFHMTEREGFFYGRGVLDDKCAAACLVAGLIRLRAEAFVPNRDIVVALTADEETGNANGVSWLLSQRHDLVDVAYCLNLDAGGGHIENGKRVRMTVQTSEKAYLSFRLETQSPGGHSSLPDKDNAIYRLAAGLTRLAKYEFPLRFNETTRAYFEGLSKVQAGSLADDMRAAAKDPPDLDAAKRLATASPYYNAILRTTCVATRLEGGHADNALPQSARAIVNCRVFPGDTLEFVRDTLTEVLADPQIRLTALGTGEPASRVAAATRSDGPRHKAQ